MRDLARKARRSGHGVDAAGARREGHALLVGQRPGVSSVRSRGRGRSADWAQVSRTVRQLGVPPDEDKRPEASPRFVKTKGDPPRKASATVV